MNAILEQTDRYTRELLIPFWAGRIEDRTHGGFQPGYDRHGRRTAVTDKAMLAQARSLVAIAHAGRLGFSWPDDAAVLARGVDFLLRSFRDPVHDGYVWMVSDDGRRILDDSKVIYGHSFLVYALAEVALLTGDETVRAEACRLFDLLMAKAADRRHGGFLEHFDRAFRPVAVRPDGRLHKSLDVHMHMMEAFTSLYELTRMPRHREALESVIALLFGRMVDPGSGLGIAMFTPDWTPIPNLPLGTLWGRDRFPPQGKPPEITSYGHNIEMAWLYLHALDVLGVPRSAGRARVEPIFAHTLRDGIDPECGGLFTEGHREHGVTETNKEFWQQAEALVGFLDAFEMTGDARYLDAFRNVHGFVVAHVICWDQGEWYPLVDRQGRVLRDDLGYHWKSGYHTVRAMVAVVTRLRRLLTAGHRVP
jgi:mannobiose 2-epimerase